MITIPSYVPPSACSNSNILEQYRHSCLAFSSISKTFCCYCCCFHHLGLNTLFSFGFVCDWQNLFFFTLELSLKMSFNEQVFFIFNNFCFFYVFSIAFCALVLLPFSPFMLWQLKKYLSSSHRGKCITCWPYLFWLNKAEKDWIGW